MGNTFKTFFLATTLTATALTGCNTAGDDQGDCNGAKCDDLADQGGLGLCVGIRGNGENMPAHFGAVARIVEHYGPIQGSAGGSSGSITQFLIEALQMNPDVYDCGDGHGSCDEDQVKARLSLLFKTLPDHLLYIGTETEQARAVMQLKQFAAGMDTTSIETIMASEGAPAAADELARLLQTSTVANLINPEIIGFDENGNPAGLLIAAQDPSSGINAEFLVNDLIESVKNFGQFSTDDKSMYFRPGLVSFDGVAEVFDKVAGFYSHLDETTEQGWAFLLNECAEASLGKTWDKAQSEFIGKSTRTCGAVLRGMMHEYWCGKEDRAGNCSKSPDDLPIRHLDRLVGTQLQAVISTSVLTGDAVGTWNEQFAQYLSGQPVDFNISWDDVKFGYWGSEGALARIAENTQGYTDAKTGKFLSLGNATWGTALKFSPAEPGLARAMAIDEQNISAGGWSDLHPTLVLKNMGCEKVVYITRTGDESKFARGVAAHFGADLRTDAETDVETDFKALYDLDREASSYSLSIAESDAVMCTNWDTESFGIQDLVADGYSADLESTDEFFTDAVEPKGRRGCASAATCQFSDCAGSPPLPAQLQCPDGSSAFGSAVCEREPTSGDCEWAIDPPECAE